MPDLVTELARGAGWSGGLARGRALCATSCSDGRWSTSTSPAASRSVRLARSRALAGGPRFRSPSVTAHGGSRSRTGGPSTSRRCRAGSRTTLRAGTSRSTRWRVRSRAASSSIRSVVRRDIAERTIRAVCSGVFEADPLRLLRAVRLEDELGFRIDAEAEQLVRRHAELASQPAGERILGELERLSTAGYRRLAELGLLDALGGSAERFDRIDLADSPEYRLVCVVRGAAAGAADLAPRSTGTAVRCSPPSHRPTILRARSTASGARPSHGRSMRSRSWGCRSFGRRSSRRVPPILPRRCFAATSSACRRAPRSAGCWS